MKKHTWLTWVLIIILISNLSFLTLVQQGVLAESFDSIRSKFEPWLWDKVQALEANGTTRFIVIGVSINCVPYEYNATAAYNFRAHVATLLSQNHNATILYIGKVLSFINAKVRVPEIKKIASYEFVDGLGDGEVKGSGKLDVSTVVIRSRVVVNELGYNGSEVRVAVLDTGINASHPDFAGKNIIWKDFINNMSTSYDDNGHGTHCAGIIAGTGQASNGKYKGAAPGVTLIIGKVLDQNNEGSEPDFRAGLDWAISEGAQIISCSFGVWRPTACKGKCELCRKADDCVRKGVVVVVAAGNEGPLSMTITCPAAAFNVITVGAIDDLNTKTVNDDVVPYFSSRGPTGDGRTKPDVVAPGWNIMSANATTGGYSNFHRTSAATPHVAGVAALILQVHPNWTPDMVKLAIKTTARLNDNLQEMLENDRGKGIVDASRAISLQGMNIPANQSESAATGGYGNYTANAYLNGTYEISAGSVEGPTQDENYAIATLNKTFTLEYNSTNPTFLFTFHDKGFMGISSEEQWTQLNATIKLFAPNGNLLLNQSKQVHYETGYGHWYYPDCHHIIEYAYSGLLCAQQNYIIEYGFGLCAYYQSYAEFMSPGYQVNGNITAEWISILDGAIFGPGNPSFEERLMYASVFEVAYWHSLSPYLFTNNSGWRHVRGDLGGGIPPQWGRFDGVCNGKDLVLFLDAFKGIYQGKYRWLADFDGDGDIDGKDQVIFLDSFKYDTPHYLDGLYSWFANGTRTGEDYIMSQWLCDHDVSLMKGQQINFTFWFEPETLTQNNASAEIHYILDNGTSQAINGTPVCPDQITWYNPYVVASIPANTIAIKIIIHGGPDFKAWVDKTSTNII